MNALHGILIALCLPLALFSSTPGEGFVEVPQKSASDYIFTIPVLTNNIHGWVIDPNSPYGVIRSEDIDWFHEAFSERESLVSGRIRANKGVGAHIVRPDFGVLWNGPVRRAIDGWLDPDVTLMGGSRIVNYIEYGSVTNVFTETFSTNYVTNALSIISMPMTNGTTSVFTNKWSASKLVKSEMTLATTSVVQRSLLDFCCVGVDVLPGYTNTPKIAFGHVVLSNGVERLLFTDFPNAGVFSNACEALRGTKRLADGHAFPTNFVQTYFEYYDDDSGDHYSDERGIYNAFNYEIKTDESYAERTYSPNVTASIPTRFTDHIATTGGFNRVSIEAVYALVFYSYHHETYGSSPASTNIEDYVLMKVPLATLDTSGEDALVKLSIDVPEFGSRAAGVLGAPSVPASLYTYRDPPNETSAWTISIMQFVIFYSITPGTVMPGW